MTTLWSDPAAAPAPQGGARTTRIGVEAVRGGRIATTRETLGDPARPGLRAMVVEEADRRARICLVPDGALLLAGDAIALDVRVGAGVRLDLVEPTGTVAYDMRGGAARWDVRIELEPGATLVWAGEPFVAAAGSIVRRDTRARLAPGSRLALRETLVLGRHGESPGRIDQSWRAEDSAGELLAEDMALGADALRPGLLGRCRVLSSVLALGFDIPATLAPAGRLSLQEGGALWRGLAAQAHDAVPREAWRAVLDLC